MKKLLLILVLICGMIGCATMKPAYHSRVTADVYLDANHTWSNSNKSKRSITLRIINNRYIAVKATVKCKFANGPEFGKKQVVVEARDDKVFVISGIPSPLFTNCRCLLTQVE